MIRGAFILATGFTLGYAVATHNQGVTAEVVSEFKRFMATASEAMERQPEETTTEGETTQS